MKKSNYNTLNFDNFQNFIVCNNKCNITKYDVKSKITNISPPISDMHLGINRTKKKDHKTINNW